MPLGLILTGWDSQIGPIVKATVPQGFTIPRDVINKILLSHSMTKDRVAEILEIRWSNQMFLSYCHKDQASTTGYMMLIIVFSEDEGASIEEFMVPLRETGTELFNLEGFERVHKFQAFGKKLFAKKTSRKILFIGPSAAGKSSIKRLFFDAVSAESLLAQPLEPTYGLVHFTYDWLDLDLGIADLAGQEMHHFLNDIIDTEIDPFESVDLILYIFDVHYWGEDFNSIIDQIRRIQELKIQKKSNAQIFVFCHKCDLIPTGDRNSFELEVQGKLSEFVGRNLFFTSITPDLLGTLMNGMQHAIGTLSLRTQNMLEVISEALTTVESVAVVLLNEQKITLEISTPDFPANHLAKINTFILTFHNLFRAFESHIDHFQLLGDKLQIISNRFDDISQEQIILISNRLPPRLLFKLLDVIRYSLVYLETSYKEGQSTAKV